MSDCLVTQLKAQVNDPSLDFFGWVRIFASPADPNIASADKNKVLVAPLSGMSVKVRIVGDYVFPDDSSKEKTITAATTIVCPDGTYDLLVEAASLKELRTYAVSNKNRFMINVKDFKGYPIQILSANRGLKGDISAFAGGSLSLLNANNCGVDLYGDISGFEIPTFNAYECAFYGDFTSLLSVSAVINTRGITDQYLVDGENYAADFSKASSAVLHAYSYTIYDKIAASWADTRPSGYPVISFEQAFDFGNDLDAMLINNDACSIVDRPSNAYYWRIRANGVRTSASDAAVASLKSKGFTIIINGTTL